MSFIKHDPQRLVWQHNDRYLWIEAWGENSLRVRSGRHMPVMRNENWALTETPVASAAQVTYEEKRATLQNGKITAVVNQQGQVSFYRHPDKCLLQEFWRLRGEIGEDESSHGQYVSALNLEEREFRPIPGGKYTIKARFEANEGEKLYGMGQYQQPNLDLKGCMLELAQRNSQASVPFLLSSHGYGFLWNNPAIGRVIFANNGTEWEAAVSEQLDYWITAGDTPAEISEAYARATGTPPMMPDYAMGFWQCKLRYRNQQELLEVAREYKRRNLPLSVIVIDFFHWPNQGDWTFDPCDWPDPDAMIAELKAMGTELMVSFWPTVDNRTESYREMKEHGWLVHTERGLPINMDFLGNTTFFDATHPEARNYVWGKAKRNYYDKGVKLFWLDEAEPEFSVYDYDNYRYHTGPVLETGNIYPRMYARTFFDGMRAAGEQQIINLLRCAWAGSQKYGALVWSGDIHSSFRSLRNQFAAGLNMGIAGIPWWTTDIGGFHGGNIHDPAFHELLIRWFQWGIFSPVMRLHGNRDPQILPEQPYREGIAQCPTGAPNEIWSYGEEVCEVLTGCLQLRESLKPYIKQIMQETHEKNTPVMRTLFFEFPHQPESWEIDDQYCFGPDLLVAPVMYAGARERTVWLPDGDTWIDLCTRERYQGGQTRLHAAPLNRIPVFIREKGKYRHLLPV
ncbi:glycoside hydrolase family 31 protein [Citrobacter rodentium]|uniref:Glycosyl hydrolase n=2 Tax=Citrobacter rodentium TaxID=67825 RepID=D2TGH9_CITRI|nr:glycoside hydrolase family 31 protein [Citrobacter rodentium]KIQ51215.1 family 31 glucosidase [Citrobacter rodentium]QBY31275.1 glycoside hydrolase family 31 protein [Citrobacter rodentium]UHO31362.1 glycoside hydrolase family 31 protein [Citrobacter rodentium NBRC 105723 = DSM 16636]CBG86798.1 putative glycosyl hydrolase [Citrobacter rodentium ICC168]HAT8013013.1 family 31 glucosidase [Citrobacter rodentium NBRC 105723 = DSM 16636]